MTHSAPKLHNAMWPGLVGKGTDPGQEPPISLERMLDLTAAANVDGQRFDGIDYFLFLPHTNPEAVKMACRIAKVFEDHGVRKYGVIRIDSAEFGVAKWRENPQANTTKIAETFREAATIARDHGQRLAAEGEICWAGMHSWKDMLDLLEEVGMPETLGFQADLAHTYLYLLGYNAPEHALVQPGYTEAEFWPAYEAMVAKLRPWTIDFHVAQNDGEVHGAGSHDKTGKHCPADDPAGKLDIVKCSGLWLEGAADRGIRHICWDGCMFPNATLESPHTWNTILKTMLAVRDAHGWG
jgi:hypothetical protein